MLEHREFASLLPTITKLCLGQRLSCELCVGNRSCVNNFDLRQKPVAATSNGLHKAGTFGRVTEGLSYFVDRFVEPVVEIYKSVCGPEFFLKFRASYDLAVVLKQHRQDLEGLFLKANSKAVLAQFASAKIQFENPKTEPPTKLMVFPHGGVNLSRKGVYHRTEFTETRGGDSFL